MNWEVTLKCMTDQTAFSAALKWCDSPRLLKLINNQINCVYRFEDAESKGYYLRITHEEIRSLKELEAALDFQQYLVKHGAPVCELICSHNGHLIEIIQQDELAFLTHVCKEVLGIVIDFNHTEKSVYYAWGKALAELHHASQSYQPNGYHFKSGQDLWQETFTYIQHEALDIQLAYQEIQAWLNTLPVNKACYGLTHGDHRPGNVLFDGKQVYIIDFDEPVYHWFMADIARPFLELGDQSYTVSHTFFKAYIEGYRSILPLEDNQLKQVNFFIRMKSLDMYLWCKNNWHEPTAPGGKPRDQWLDELKKLSYKRLFL